MNKSLLASVALVLSTSGVLAGGIVNGTLSASGGGGLNGTNGINGVGVTNILGSNIQQQSTNTVYYFDPYATNAISAPNNPLAPYHLLDSVNTVALTQPTTFILAPGIYNFTNAMTNVSCIGSGVGSTLLVCGNTNYPGLDGQPAEQAMFFLNSISNLTIGNFTCGASPGGTNVVTNYVTVVYTALTSTGIGNVTFFNINYPFTLASWGLTNSGSSLDGWYLKSTHSQQMTLNNVNQDVPWDCFMNYDTSNSTIALNNCNFYTRQVYSAAPNGNNAGAGHCFSFPAPGPGNGTVISAANCVFNTYSTTNLGDPFSIVLAAAGGTNISMSFVNDTMFCAHSNADFTLNVNAGVAVGAASLNVAGGLYDTNMFSYAGNALAYWTPKYSYVDWQGNSQVSSVANFGNGVLSIIGSAAHIPHTVTVGASVFNFINPNPQAIEVYISDAAAYSVTKNGVAIFGSLAGDCYTILQPTNAIAITYLSTTPTMTTNAW